MAKRKAEAPVPGTTIAATLVLVVEFTDTRVDEGDHIGVINDLLQSAQNGGRIKQAFVEYAARDSRIVTLVPPVEERRDVVEGEGS